MSLYKKTPKTTKPNNQSRVIKEELEDGEISVLIKLEPEEGEMFSESDMSKREAPIPFNIRGDTIKDIKEDWENLW